MKVLLISLFSDMPHHVATELEILQRHLDDGDDISVLGCQGGLPACMHKREDKAVRCRECLSTRSNALRLLDRAPKTYSLETFFTPKDRQAESSIRRSFDSIDDIRDYTFDGFDLGYAALSSTVFVCRDAYLQRAEDRALLGRMIISAYRTFCSVREFLRVHPDFDLAYIFNGRFATCRGAFRACQQADLNVQLHERGSSNAKFMLYENKLPHDLQAMEARIRERWEKASDEERQKGRKFFEDRRQRVEAFWHSHTKSQQAGRLPDSWDESKRNVIVYTSSDDEYVAIGKEWVTPGFDSQSQAIVNLHNNLRAKNSDIRLYVRMHPHLKGVDNKDTRMLYELNGEGVELIPPESAVCSYALMDGSEKIVTFGSTIGIEATYSGKPSILAGMNFYRALNGAHVAASDDELLRLVEEPLDPKPQEAALMFGLHMVSFGQPFNYYKSTNFETGRFRGTLLKTSMGYSLFGFVLPYITRMFGERPSLCRSLEQLAYAICHAPFLVLYDLASPLRKRLRS